MTTDVESKCHDMIDAEFAERSALGMPRCPDRDKPLNERLAELVSLHNIWISYLRNRVQKEVARLPPDVAISGDVHVVVRHLVDMVITLASKRD